VQLTSAIRIGRPAPEVLDALLDAGTVAACLPGSRLIGEVADSTYAGELHLQIGPMRVVYTGTVRLDSADRDAGTATLRASGWERGGPGRADASVTLRVESRGATTRVLISADLTIRGQVAEYAPGAIGHVGQRLVEQFAGNVEQLLETQASGAPVSTGSVSTGPASTSPGSTGPDSTSPGSTRLVSTGPAPPGPDPPRVDRRLLAASALLLAGGALAAGALAAVAVWRRRHPGLSLPPDTPWYFSHEGARHG
jgi:carbon monoxide dehydrogenase subunit G